MRIWLVLAALAGCTAQAVEPEDSGPQSARDRLTGASQPASELDDAATTSEWLWPGGDIYAIVDAQAPGALYFFGPTTAGGVAPDYLRAAAAELEAKTPIRVHFVSSTDEVEGDYFVNMTELDEDSDDNPSATVGTNGLAGDLTIQATASSVRHELGHVVGLRHTHQRNDRDEHVSIHWDYVKSGKLHNFNLRDDIQDIGPYDFRSVMHYWDMFFTNQEDCLTITMPGVTDPCDVAWEDRIPVNYGEEKYSTWNYVTISALYCDSRYCGENCASEERCGAPEVVKNLERLRHFEETGSTKLPADLAVCGDDVVDEGEECDGEYWCRDNCKPGTCGDGILDPKEHCDDATESEECNADCTWSYCGDGIVNRAAGEECDDTSGACGYDCKLAVCGDGFVQYEAGEVCDDGTRTGDACKTECDDDYAYADDAGGGCSSAKATSLAPALLLLLACLGLRRKYHPGLR